MQPYDMRDIPDRRRKPTSMVSRYIFCGRRGHFRRREEQRKGGYVDRYDSALLFWILLIVVFNILDAFFTLLILDNGGWEVNPVSRWAIEAFGDHFILWKLALICSSMVILCLHCKFRMAQRVIYFAALLYSSIVLYQIVLMTQVML